MSQEFKIRERSIQVITHWCDLHVKYKHSWKKFKHKFSIILNNDPAEGDISFLVKLVLIRHTKTHTSLKNPILMFNTAIIPSGPPKNDTILWELGSWGQMDSHGVFPYIFCMCVFFLYPCSFAQFFRNNIINVTRK